MKNIVFLILSFLFSAAHGITPIGDSTDADCKDFATNFPNVGYFATADGIPFASGVLIDTKTPHLNGRVVLTASHVFSGFREEVSFNMGGQKLNGDAIPHPVYTILSETRLASGYDIAFFFLERAVRNIPLATFNLNLSFDDILKTKYFSLCGFGRHNLLDTSSDFTDRTRRACYSFASKELNYRDAYQPRVSVINLSPDCFLEPAGLSASGDSGGGMFLAEGGDLAGIIVTGTIMTKNAVVFKRHQTSVLLGFHKDWISTVLEKLSAENSIANLVLPVFPLSSWEEKITTSKVVSISKKSSQTQPVTKEMKFAKGFPNSLATIDRALLAKSWLKVVSDRTIEREDSSLRYNCALNLLESPNSTIKNLGIESLLLLAKDSEVLDNLRLMALDHICTSKSVDDSNLVRAAYYAIMNDESVKVGIRIDTAYRLLGQSRDLSELWSIIKNILKLSPHDIRYKKNPLLNAIFVLGRNNNPLIRNTSHAYFLSLSNTSENYSDQEVDVCKDLNWKLIWPNLTSEISQI